MKFNFQALIAFWGSLTGKSPEPAASLPRCLCRPTDPCWPDANTWSEFNKSVGGTLTQPESPIEACLAPGADAFGEKCQAQLKLAGEDPFYLQTMASGIEAASLVNAFNSSDQISEYAVRVRNARDIQESVKFANKHNLKLVVKATGHDYYGRSMAPDSLLVWTHDIKGMSWHENWQPNCGLSSEPGVSAVTLGAGLRWIEVYQEGAKRDKFVLGGGCTSVGVVGWTIGGGFGSWSKKYGTGAVNLLEATVVTADGRLVKANKCENPDLYWAMRGGGHGFGVVVDITVKAFDLPKLFGDVNGKLQASTVRAYEALLAEFLRFSSTSLKGEQWGETIMFYALPEVNTYVLELSLATVDLTTEQVSTIWAPFRQWLGRWNARYPNDKITNVDSFGLKAAQPSGKLGSTDFSSYPKASSNPAKGKWAPGNGVASKYGPPGSFFWGPEGDAMQVSATWMGYSSRYLTHDQIFKNPVQGAKILTQFIQDGAPYLNLHFNKAQFSGNPANLAEIDNTAMNPAVKDAFALLILAFPTKSFHPKVSYEAQEKTSYAPAIADAIRQWNYRGLKDETDWWKISQTVANGFESAIKGLRSNTPGAGSYFNEASYFEPNWQQNFWGKDNYEKLLKAKRKWDPNGLFNCHKCVGSEYWTSDGFCRVKEPTSSHLQGEDRSPKQQGGPQQGRPHGTRLGGAHQYPQQGGAHQYPQQGGAHQYPQQGGAHQYPQQGGARQYYPMAANGRR